MDFSLNVVFSFSVAVGVAIGWVRYHKTDPAFLPFLLLLTVGLLNEIISYSLISVGQSNAVNYNLYSLVEAMLVIWQFKKWGFFGAGRWHVLIQVALVAAFTTEWLLRHEWHAFNSYFLMGYSLLIVFMSIYMVNRLLFSITGNLLREPVFLICMGFSVYFSYTVLVEAFWLYGLNQSRSFRLSIYDILSYINLFTNLLYAVAILWIPLKPRYIMR